MSDVMGQIPKDHPLMVAWEKYKRSDEFANTQRWMITGVTTGQNDLIIGQFWGAFVKGWDAALKVGERTALDAVDTAFTRSVLPTSDKP